MVHSDFREKIVLKYDTVFKNRGISEKLENVIYDWCLKDMEKKGMTISESFYRILKKIDLEMFKYTYIIKHDLTPSKKKG